MADEIYTPEFIEVPDFSLEPLQDELEQCTLLPHAKLTEVEEEFPTQLYLPLGNAAEDKPAEVVKEPEEMKGTVLKKKGGEWKDRYMHLRPNVRALFYYEKLAKAQKNCKPLGVYPLLGATVDKLQQNAVDESFTFNLTLRTGQKIWFKLLDRQEARGWRSALRDTAKLPCTAPSEGTCKDQCFLKQTFTKAKRTIVLDYSSGYFCTYQKIDELTPMEQHLLKESMIIPQKSFDASYHVIIQTGKAYRKEYTFKTPEEWAKWCVELEAVVNREKHSMLNSR